MSEARDRFFVLSVRKERVSDLANKLSEHQQKHANDNHVFEYAPFYSNNLKGEYEFFQVILEDKSEQIELQNYCDSLNGFI